MPNLAQYAFNSLYCNNIINNNISNNNLNNNNNDASVTWAYA